MKRKVELFKSAALLCMFSIMCKLCGMLFRLYLASRIGTEGLGLYQIILSVYTLFATFATAGLSVSVSRITAEEQEKSSDGKNAARTLNTSMRIGLVLGMLSFFCLFTLAMPISHILPENTKTVMPLRILAMSMPFMSLSSCIKGWFIGSRKILIPASSQLFEEFCKMGLTVGMLTFFCSKTNDTGILCTGIAAGLTAGELFSFLYVYAFRFAKEKTVFLKNESRYSSIKRITDIALPIATGSWLTGGLHAMENILIPYCFTLCGGSQAKALSDFGLIRGMVIPVLFFPFSFLSAFISILIPEVSRLNIQTDKKQRDRQIERALRLTATYSMCAGGMFFFFPDEIGIIFYNSREAAESLRLLSVVTPFMYIETISDGLLKGIGEQKYSMRVTLSNCVLRIGAIFLLIPSTGAKGYIWLLIISNTYSFLMCYGRLIRVTSIHMRLFSTIAVPAIWAFISCMAGRIFCNTIGFENVFVTVLSGLSFSLVLYSLIFLKENKYGTRKAV